MSEPYVYRNAPGKPIYVAHDDAALFQKGFLPEEMQKQQRDAHITEQQRRRLAIGQRLAFVVKLAMNERFALEEALTAQGMAEFSSALYSLEWKELRDELDVQLWERRKRGYWKNLWLAVKGQL